MFELESRLLHQTVDLEKQHLLLGITTLGPFFLIMDAWLFKKYIAFQIDFRCEEKSTSLANSRGSSANSLIPYYPIPCVFLVASYLGMFYIASWKCVVSTCVGIANDSVCHIYSGFHWQGDYLS